MQIYYYWCCHSLLSLEVIDFLYIWCILAYCNHLFFYQNENSILMDIRSIFINCVPLHYLTLLKMRPSALKFYVCMCISQYVCTHVFKYVCCILVYLNFRWTHVAQASLQITMSLSMTLSLWFYCLHLEGTVITDMYHCVEFKIFILAKFWMIYINISLLNINIW